MKQKLPPLTPLLSHGEQCRLLGQKARAFRKQKGLSRHELARASGVSYATISRFETTGVTSVPVLLKLATALDALSTLDGMFESDSFSSLEEFEGAERV